MTVAELIEELQKFPGHHRVFVEHPEITDMDACGFSTDLASVAEVRSDGSCTVIIDATGGVQ